MLSDLEYLNLNFDDYNSNSREHNIFLNRKMRCIK